jgi:NADPH-dependent glutamate synthase beta subunit-like oxidoreductase
MPPVFSKEMKERIITTGGLGFQRRTSPCEPACPAGNPIQKMHALVADGRPEEALEYLLSRNPFPAITGRICPHPCEKSCNRIGFDEGLAIRAVERHAADTADPARVRQPVKREPSGKRIAIVGSGPAGLTCAYFSALFGHEVTVFEAGPTIGGIPRNAVPDFRLQKDVVDREIGKVLDLGVRVRVNTRVGRDIALDRIVSGFDACLLAVGLGRERTLDIPGGELARPAVSWLKAVNLAERHSLGDKVVVIGGGGVGFDAAFTAKRLGASEVHVICLESREKVCVPMEEVCQAEDEGITVHHSCLPKRILNRDGRIEALELTRVASFCFDAKGCLAVDLEPGSEFIVEADAVIYAIGLTPDVAALGAGPTFALTPRGALAVDRATMATSVPGVYAAGDIALGPATVAAGVGSGRTAALAMDRYLRGEAEARPTLVRLDACGRVESVEAVSLPAAHQLEFEELMNVEQLDKKPREQTRKLPPDEAGKTFLEVDQGFSPEQARSEAARCIHCGHCIACGSCVDDCPGHILSLTPDGPVVAYPDECWHCGCCRISCPRGAVAYEFPINMLL